MDAHIDKYDFSMNKKENRLATFEDWPFNHFECNCTAEKMAAAGFYHCASDQDPDVARCFVCFKELEGWEPEDDPWDEHKKHSPKCEFLRLAKTELDLTVEEFLDLELKRQINRMKKISDAGVKEYEDMYQQVREEMTKLKDA